MAVRRGNRRESGTLNKEVQIVSSLGDTTAGKYADGTSRSSNAMMALPAGTDTTQMYDGQTINTYALPAAAINSQTGAVFNPSPFADGLTLDQIIDEMRDAQNQDQAQLYANLLNEFFVRLPGGSADFGQEATSLTDTIFGDAYDSMFPGLITGSITANAIIKGIPGYQVVIRQTGKPVGMQAKLQRITGNTFAFQSLKTSGGRTESPVFTFDLNDPPEASDFKQEDYATDLTNQPAMATDFSIDYLFGEVTFEDDPQPGVDVIGFVGDAVPLVTVGRAQNYNLTQTLNPVDETDFDTAQNNDGRRKFVAGLKNANLELSGFWRNRNNFLQQLNEREPVLMSIDPTGQGDAICRMYAFLMRQGQRGDVGALEEESVNFELNVLDDVRVKNPVGWKFGYYNKAGKTIGGVKQSIVSVANQMLLDAWLCGTHVGIRYLPNGRDASRIGLSSIKTGYTTAAIVTDASLSSSLDGVAEFQASFQLDGHVARRGQVTRLGRTDSGDLTAPGAAGGMDTVEIQLQDENGNPLVARAGGTSLILINPPTGVTIAGNINEGLSTGTGTITVAANTATDPVAMITIGLDVSTYWADKDTARITVPFNIS